VRRLFSTLTDGLPGGAGLLMLRFFLRRALMLSAIGAVPHGSMTAAIANALAAVAGMFLLVGLWTPIVGAIVAITELWIVLLLPQDLRLHVLQAVFSMGLAMIGPGVWSVDARLYGWRRVEIPSRKS
jgi:putative oxidoreductase